MNFNEINALIEEAKQEINENKYDSAEKNCRKVIDHIEDLPSVKREQYFELNSEAYRVLSEISIKTGQNTEAYDFGKKALSFALQSKSKLQESKALNSLGNQYLILSNYRIALEYYKKTLKIVENQGNKIYTAATLSNIGRVYISLNDYSNALIFLKKALLISREIDNKLLNASNLLSIGIVYKDQTDFENAVTSLNKALAIFEDHKNSNGICFCLMTLGSIYFEQGSNTKGLRLLDKAIRIAEGSDFYFYMQQCYAQKARILMRKDPADLRESRTYFEKAVEISKKYDYLKTLSFNYKELAELSRIEGRWKEASKYFRKFHKIDKEIYNEEVLKQAKQFAQEREIIEKEKELAIQQAATEAKHQATQALLYKVLPNEIANRMLNGEEEIADYFPEISILFADIKGFTPLTSNMPAPLVVRLLNSVFNRFDEIIKKYGCTKIKTIGDGYMAVAGAPEPCEDHSVRLVKAAFEFIEDIQLPEEIKEHISKDAGLKIRVGLHVGPAVAGVIGKDRFVYDIYSDAVNLASRMESNGEADRVHASAGFTEHLQNRFKKTGNTKHGIKFVDRGEMEVKGKGKMNTYFLEKE